MCMGPRRQFQLHAPHPRPMRWHNYYAITAPFGFNQIFVIEEPPVWAFGSRRPFANANKTVYAATHPVMMVTALITFPSDNYLN